MSRVEIPGCEECGQPCRRDERLDIVQAVCSDACSKAFTARCIGDGSLVVAEDLSPERLNAALETVGLQIAGVGKMVRS